MHIDRYATPRSFCRTAIVLAAALVAIAASPVCLTAQTYWRVPAAVGGALVGAGAGWAVDIVAWGGGDLGGPELRMTPAGIGLGAVIGFIAGLNADHHLARGKNLTRGSRVSLRTALFLTPIAIGSAVAFAMINPSDDALQPQAVSDETVALVAIGGGTLVGLFAQHKFARALWPKTRVNVAPTGGGVMLSIPVGW
jgi:hypothetical protein